MPRPRPDLASELERLQLDMLPQPDDFTCGPTCLHAVYRYYGDEVPLDELIAQVPKSPSGGTLDVHLANHALRRGYRATIYSYNLRVFDPTWFVPHEVDLASRLREQAAAKGEHWPMLRHLTAAFLEFLQLGGRLRLVDLGAPLLRRYLRRGVPILCGLSATYLYRRAREFGPDDVEDDVRGEPQGHFVVLCGYRPRTQSVLVADPFANPLAHGRHWEVALERVVGAIFLGVLTHDANLLLIEPGKRQT
jgi:hypothetical protein